MPAVVLLLGMLAAAALTLLGARELRAQGTEAAALRARLLAEALAARVGSTAAEHRAHVLERAAKRSGAELLLVDARGETLVDATVGAPPREQVLDLLMAVNGATETSLGAVRFHVVPLQAPLEHLAVVSLVGTPEAPFGTASLFGSVASLTGLLLGLAFLVALALAGDVQHDLTSMAERIRELAATDRAGSTRPVPIRSADRVGQVTAALNRLLERFEAAELAWRQDLATARASDRERSEFLAALSHELRTPLNAILGFADVLLAEVDGPLSAEARENLEVVKSSGAHLKALIDDILELGALESGELGLSLERVDVSEVVAEVAREAGLAVERKGLALSLALAPATAWADPHRVRQIVGNLLGNAVKFTAEGTIGVEVSKAPGGVRVAVSDTGPGIASSEQEAIFEEYRQAGDLAARRVGTGLGLAITRRLVEMHGGSIRVESRIGVGSRFSVFLPAVATPPARSSSARAPSVPPPPGGPTTP